MSARGLILMEILIALALGILLVGGALFLLSRGRGTHATQEVAARLQEQGRYLLAVMEPDFEMAGYYGFSNSPLALRFIENGDAARVVAFAADLRQLALPANSAPPPLAMLPASAHACGSNFAVDVTSPVQGSNNGFALGPGATSACKPFAPGAQALTDTVTIRRVATDVAPADAGRLQIYAARGSSRSAQLMFIDGRAPGNIDSDHEVHDLLVRSYYVARRAVDGTDLPSLRVKALTTVAGVAAFADTEVMPGVEDLQVQFGIDTGDYDNDGQLDASADADGDGLADGLGHVTRYVNPDFADLRLYQIVAVRLWVRVRAAEREAGFVDLRTYQYADISFTPTGAQRAFRRALFSRTITLRNARKT